MAVFVDASGHGVRESAPRNATVCSALLTHLAGCKPPATHLKDNKTTKRQRQHPSITICDICCDSNKTIHLLRKAKRRIALMLRAPPKHCHLSQHVSC